MSDDRSPRLALPYLSAGQAQKETIHNEALALLDLLVQPVVQAAGLNAPPVAPAVGQCWIIGTAPTGDWSGQARALAGWTANGWRFAAPTEAMGAWSLADHGYCRFLAGAWVTPAATAGPAGGSVIDAEGRSVIFSILSVLRSHGLIAT